MVHLSLDIQRTILTTNCVCPHIIFQDTNVTFSWVFLFKSVIFSSKDFLTFFAVNIIVPLKINSNEKRECFTVVLKKRQ